MEATAEASTAQSVYDDIMGGYKQMTPEQQQGFNDAVKLGMEDKEAGFAALASNLDSLPTHVREQIQRGLVGAEQLTEEQLRDLARISAIDGDVAGLAFSGRGNTQSNPGDWQEVVASGLQGQQFADGETVAPPAGLPDRKGGTKDTKLPDM